MVTKKVVESASETDDETEVAPKPEVKKAVNKKEVTFLFMFYHLITRRWWTDDSLWQRAEQLFNFDFQTTEEAPAAKKQKVVAPGAKKQQGIASFFTKK